MVIIMVRCKICKKTRNHGGAKGKCWRKHRLCSLCAVVAYPEEYKKNFIFATFAKNKKYKSRQVGKKYKVTSANRCMYNGS